MSVLDPTGFQIAVVIVDNDTGRRYPLWVVNNSDEAPGGDIGDFDLPIVESVELTIGLGTNVKVSIDIAASFTLGLKILESPLLKIGNTYEVQLGYPRIGRFTPWFSAMATLPNIRITPDEGLSATLEGSGGGFAALRTRDSTQFTNKSYIDIIREVVTPFGWNLIVPTGSSALNQLKTIRPSVSQGNQFPWFFIQNLCRQSGCDGYIQPDPTNVGASAFVIVERVEAHSRQPTHEFNLRGRADFERIFPILEFETTANLVWAPAAASSTRTADIDPDTGQEIVATATGVTSAIPRTSDTIPGTTGQGERRIFTPAGPTATGQFVSHSARDPGTQQEAVTAANDEAADGQGITGSLLSYGIPEMLPGNLVTVSGAGAFSGNYHIDELVHKAGPGEWSMNMNVTNNAMTQTLMSEYFSATPASTNTSQPTPSPGDAVSGATTDVVAEPEG